jgi:hypothetical protein
VGLLASIAWEYWDPVDGGGGGGPVPFVYSIVSVSLADHLPERSRNCA